MYLYENACAYTISSPNMKLKSPYSLSFGFCTQPPLQHAKCGDDPQAEGRAVLTDYHDELSRLLPDRLP